MVDRFEELRTYVTVVETGGVNAAAAKLGIARSAASRRLSELEARVGATLVERSTRRFELTATGQRYYADAKSILDELARIDASVGQARVPRETIVVDVPPGLVAAVASSLAGFLDAHPGTALRVVHASRRDKPSLSVSAVDERGGRPVGSLRTVAVCSPSYLERHPAPKDLADLDGHTAIAVEGTEASWTNRSGARLAPTTAVTVGDDASAIAMALAGGGIAQLPRELCAPALKAGVLVEVLPGLGARPRPIFAHVADESPAAAALLDHMTNPSSD